MSIQEIGILTNIEISGFKSIKEMNLDLNPINIIIGQNGAGKSNFINIFKLLNRIVKKELQLYTEINGGADRFFYFGTKVTDKIYIKISFNSGNDYELVLRPAVPNTIFIETETVRYNPKKNYDSLGGGLESKIGNTNSYKAKYVKQYLQGARIYHFHDVSDNSPIKKTCSISDNLFLQSQADNLPAMLYFFKKNYEYEYRKIVSVINMVAPFFQDFVLEPENKNIILRWKHVGYDKVFDVYDLSDGTLRFIALVTLLLQPNNFIPHTIIIDEPELGLHPYALRILAELFQNVTKKGKQIIATSQSVEFINEFNYKDIIITDRRGEKSYFRHLEEDEIKQWINDFSIGDIWKKNIIGGTPNDY